MTTALTLARDALSRAKRFIANGRECGYIRMPDADCADPAHETPGKIDEALAAIDAELAASADAGRLAKIDRDESMDRSYIPFPGGWELQTKGKGSSLRLCDTKLGERYTLALPEFIVQFVERFAHEVHAALARPAPAEVAPDTVIRADKLHLLNGGGSALTSRVEAPVSAQGDEQAAFEAWWMRADSHLCTAWDGWQARAQVAQGDEQAAFEAWAESKLCMRGSPEWISGARMHWAREAWQARAQQGGQ